MLIYDLNENDKKNKMCKVLGEEMTLICPKNVKKASVAGAKQVLERSEVPAKCW